MALLGTLATSVIAALAVLALTAVSYAKVAVHQRHLAEKAEAAAERNAEEAERRAWLAQTAADTSQLPPLPLRQGQKLGDDSVQVGNPTYVLHSYRLNAGGFESYVSFKEGSTAYLFDFKQDRGSQPDTTLFEMLLGSVIVAG